MGWVGVLDNRVELQGLLLESIHMGNIHLNLFVRNINSNVEDTELRALFEVQLKILELLSMVIDILSLVLALIATSWILQFEVLQRNLPILIA